MPQRDPLFRPARPGRFRSAHFLHQAVGDRRGESVCAHVFLAGVASFASTSAADRHLSLDTAPRCKGAAPDGALPLVLLDGGLFGFRLRKAKTILAASRGVLAEKRSHLQRRGYGGVLRRGESQGTRDITR